MRIERHREDIPRIIDSIHAAAMPAFNVIRMLSRADRPTPPGDVIAHQGRISKTLHILRPAHEPGYRRQFKTHADLQERRHALGRKILHGRAPGSSTRTTRTAWRPRSARSAWSSTPWCSSTPAPWTLLSPGSAPTASMSATETWPPLPFVRHHINTLRRYSFRPSELPGGLRPLSDPNVVDEG